MQSEEQTQLSFLEAETALHYRHGNAEVLANEIEGRITDDGTKKHAFLPEAIFLRDLVRIV